MSAGAAQDCWLFDWLTAAVVKEQRQRETSAHKAQPPGLPALRVGCLGPPLSLIKERLWLGWLKLSPLSLAKEALSSGEEL